MDIFSESRHLGSSSFYYFEGQLSMACRILVPQPGFKSTPPAVRAQSLTTDQQGSPILPSRLLTPKYLLQEHHWSPLAGYLHTGASQEQPASTQGGLLHPAGTVSLSGPTWELFLGYCGAMRARNEGPQTDQPGLPIIADTLPSELPGKPTGEIRWLKTTETHHLPALEASDQDVNWHIYTTMHKIDN